jgi:hypothetical protein
VLQQEHDAAFLDELLERKRGRGERGGGEGSGKVREGVNK